MAFIRKNLDLIPQWHLFAKFYQTELIGSYMANEQAVNAIKTNNI